MIFGAIEAISRYLHRSLRSYLTNAWLTMMPIMFSHDLYQLAEKCLKKGMTGFINIYDPYHFMAFIQNVFLSYRFNISILALCHSL